MPPRSAFAGGWSEATAKKLEKITVPDKIKCGGCKKIRVQGAYSKKQLTDLRHKIYLNDRLNPLTGGHIKCRHCTGQQVHELTCCICDETRGLEGFSKAQRRDPDKARCLDCVNLHETLEPGLEDDDETDSDTASNPYESDAGDDVESGVGLPVASLGKLAISSKPSDGASLGGIRLSGKGKATETNSIQSPAGGVELDSQDAYSNAREWDEQPRRGRGSILAGSNVAGSASSITFDPFAYGHRSYASTVTTDQHWQNVKSKSRKGKPLDSIGNKNDRFPRVPAYKPRRDDYDDLKVPSYLQGKGNAEPDDSDGESDLLREA
ncbi:MAG: hypothetical protein M1819_001065 [Sarea resinae]|nr:MAG: hypothetical protein M1819_001065 [Sarea resinae]